MPADTGEIDWGWSAKNDAADIKRRLDLLETRFNMLVKAVEAITEALEKRAKT